MASNEERREAAKRKLEARLERPKQPSSWTKRLTIAGTIVAIVLAAGLGLYFVVQQAQQETPEAAEDGTGEVDDSALHIPTERAPVPERPAELGETQSCDYGPGAGEASRAVEPPEDGEVPARGRVDVVLESTEGDIPLTLDRSLAPCTVHSMINLIEQDFYDDTACHRLGTQGLQMLQCGDPDGDGTGGPGYTIPDEHFDELHYGRGLLAMARTPEPNSGGSQFFMVYGHAELPPEYTVFGTIGDAGLQILDSVAHDGIATPGEDGTGPPNTEVRFTDATVEG
ncbi:peptidylprolyl isomerase [Haloechinothrix sp. LS1_15]|uniref:peptidylprolyl isomerase n=1 Tax=Haloechinothrix sp. LS1_15 TaxID=2652248 RepID=UPI002946A609|nr:peptidylprolyl isomerase [Haloechinothrix sp. LS1_15]MDV6013315.1 peptidylprolyl isomerase [Haloechinothrix sp. LS1_15]